MPDLYQCTKPVETIAIGRKRRSGIVLKRYKHAGQLYAEPVYATDGKDYLSNLSSKGHGCVFIPEELLKERNHFRIVIGKRGSRRIYHLRDCRVKDGYFWAELYNATDERLQPKELPIVLARVA